MTTPEQPVIRRGQRVPYHKGTQREIDQRRGFVVRMLDVGATKMEIHRAVRDKFNVQWRQCDRYIAFVTGANTGTDTRLTRARPEDSQSMLSQMLATAKIIYGDKAK